MGSVLKEHLRLAICCTLLIKYISDARISVAGRAGVIPAAAARLFSKNEMELQRLTMGFGLFSDAINAMDKLGAPFSNRDLSTEQPGY